MISDEQILKAIEKEDRKIKLENLIYSLPALMSACASQDVKDLDVSQTSNIYDQHIAIISEESTPEQVDALVHKIMDANITLENVLTKENERTMSDRFVLLNKGEINQAKAFIYEIARHSTFEGVQDVLSTHISTEVNGNVYALFIEVRRDQNRNLTYRYNEYFDGKRQEIGGRDGVKKVLYKILKTPIETKDLENTVYADNPVKLKTVEKALDKNYDKLDLIMAGAIVACSLITYVIGRRFGYFGGKNTEPKLLLQQPDSKE